MNGKKPETLPIDGADLAQLEQIELASQEMQKDKQLSNKTLHEIFDALAILTAKFGYVE